MNRLELRNLVVANLGARTDKTSAINSALNLGLEHIAGRYPFRGLKQADTLASDSSSPPIDGIDGALVAYATAYVFRQVEKLEDAGFWDKAFERELAGRIAVEQRTPTASATTGTLAGLRRLVQANIGFRTDRDDIIREALNLGIRDAFARHPFKLHVSTTDIALALDGSQVTLPADFSQLVELRIIDGTFSRPIEVRSKAVVMLTYPDVSADSTTAGYCEVAYEESGKLFFAPRSNKAVTVRLTYMPRTPTLTNDSDTLTVQGLDAALVAFATSHTMRSLGMFKEAVEFDRQYERHLAAAIQADNRKPALVNKLQRHPGPSPFYNTPDPYDAFAGLRRRPFWR